MGNLPDNASKFELLGQRDEANIYAMGKTVEQHLKINNAWGMNIQARILTLQDVLIKELESKIPEVPNCTLSFLTPKDPRLSNGIVFFKIQHRSNDIDHGELNNFLYEDVSRYKRFAVATTRNRDYLRICLHIMILDSQLGQVVAKIVFFLRQKYCI